MTVQIYGNQPGVTAEVIGGSVANATVGFEQKLVVFGRGDTSSGEASADTPVQIRTSVDASTQFGEGTHLAHELDKALQNGANYQYVYGVAPTETDVSAEPIAGGSGTLTNAPIVEDPATISITNTTTGSSATLVFRYESAPDTTELDADQVAINPLTGEVASGGADDYEIDYSYLEWQQALDAADHVVDHKEGGVYDVLSDSEAVAQILSEKLDDLRPTYKLISGAMGAQPNATNADGQPIVDTETYTDSIDNDALFLFAPVRLSGVGDDSDGYGGVYGDSYGSSDSPVGWTILGGIGGVLAGNTRDNPILADGVEGYGSLIQQLTNTEEGQKIGDDGSGGTGLRGEQVIPVRDNALDGEGGISIQDHISTSTATDYRRDYHRRRIIDRVLIAGKEIGDALRGQMPTDEQLSYTENTMLDVMQELADARLLVGNPQDESNNPDSNQADDEEQYSAQLVQTDTATYAFDIRFKPIGVVEHVEETLVVDQNSAGA